MRRVHVEQGARGRPAAVPANRSSARAKHSCRAHSRDNPAAQGPPSRRVHTQATTRGQERTKRGAQERQRRSHDSRASQPSQGHASTRVLTGAGGPGACHRTIPIKSRPSDFVSLIASVPRATLDLKAVAPQNSRPVPNFTTSEYDVQRRSSEYVDLLTHGRVGRVGCCFTRAGPVSAACG